MLDMTVARLARRLVAVFVALAAVVAFGLVVIGRSDLGADGVLVSLALVGVLAQAVIVAAMVYVIASLRRSSAKAARFRARMLRRSRRLVRQGMASRKRDQARATQIARAHNEAQRLHLVTQRQTQALLNLGELVRLEAAVPPAGGWAASPDLILYCVDRLLAERPELLVECGSGVSTLFLALAAQQHGLATRLVALEHDEHYANSTRALLERHGVDGRVEVRLAPLARSSVPGHETPWYSESALDGLDRIGMLLVDGPPMTTGPLARFPAVPLLREHFAARCTIVMDDLNRASDQETANLWSAMLDDFDYSVIREFDKHLGVLRRA